MAKEVLEYESRHDRVPGAPLYEKWLLVSALLLIPMLSLLDLDPPRIARYLFLTFYLPHFAVLVWRFVVLWRDDGPMSAWCIVAAIIYGVFFPFALAAPFT